jgi:hypothetical protein
LQENAMFEKNMGQSDRAIRAVVGVILVIAYFMVAGAWSWLLLLIGLVLLATAALGTCPPYSLLGIRTNR